MPDSGDSLSNFRLPASNFMEKPIADAAYAQREHLHEARRAFDSAALIEPPVLIYNASPYVEASQRIQLPVLNGDATQGTSDETTRVLRNGCVEVVDARTGQRTRIAGDRCFGCLKPMSELMELSQDDGSEVDLDLLSALLSEGEEEKKMEAEEGTICSSNVLSPTAVANTPQMLKREDNDWKEISLFSKKMKYGENQCPVEMVESEDPFMMHYQNFYVLNKEVIQKRNGQTGYCGCVEKIRVEMESLDDGYKSCTSDFVHCNVVCRWRKYGRKAVKGNTYPRSYFKCTFPNCMCRKQVEQNPKNPRMLIATYEGRHIHPPPFVSQQTCGRLRR